MKIMCTEINLLKQIEKISLVFTWNNYHQLLSYCIQRVKKNWYITICRNYFVYLTAK